MKNRNENKKEAKNNSTDIIFGDLNRTGCVAIEMWQHEYDRFASVVVKPVADVENGEYARLIEQEFICHF